MSKRSLRRTIFYRSFHLLFIDIAVWLFTDIRLALSYWSRLNVITDVSSRLKTIRLNFINFPKDRSLYIFANSQKIHRIYISQGKLNRRTFF